MSLLRRVFDSLGLGASPPPSSDVLIARVVSHPALAEPWPHRPELDAAAYLALSDAELEAFTRRGLAARSGLPAVDDLLVDLVALDDDPAAIPVLTRLWQKHPLNRVRAYAADALLTMGTKEAFAALRTMENDWDPLSLRICAESLLLDADAVEALRYRLRRVHAGDRSSLRLLCVVCDVARHARESRAEAIQRFVWTRPFMDFAASVLLEEDDRLVRSARAFLRHVVGEDVVAAVAALPRKPPVAPRRTWGDSYRAPAQRTLAEPWSAYAGAGPIDGPLREEAMRAATELMQRMARNADLLNQRLRAVDWPLPWYARQPAGTKASLLETFPGYRGEERAADYPDLLGHLVALSEAVEAPIPVALEAYWREVGGISWALEEDAPLPSWLDVTDAASFETLEVLSLPELWNWVVRWKDEADAYGIALVGPLELSLRYGMAIDATRASVRLPSYEADPLVHGPPGDPRFVSYLRHAFAWGGLPGLSTLPRTSKIDAIVKELTRDLEPF